VSTRPDAARREHQVHAGATPNVNDGRACWKRGHPKRVCDACKGSRRLGWECGERGGVVSESLGGIGGTTMKVELARGIAGDPRINGANLLPKSGGVEITGHVVAKRLPFNVLTVRRI
jgi:hypothetical protein